MAKSAGPDSDAGKYMIDKQTSDRLHTSQTDLATAVDKLRQEITSGAFTVRLAMPTPVTTDHSGRAEPNSSEDPGHS